MNVQNGLSTSFWYDTWTDMGRLIDFVGTRGCIEMGIRATATVASAIARRKRTHRVDLYNLFEEALENQRHKMSDRADVPLWQYSEDMWSLLMKGLLRSSFTTEWGALLQLTMDTTLDMKSRLLLRTTLQASVHSVWRERNDRRHGATPMNPTLLVKMIDRQIRNWCLTVTATGHNKY
ncbi:BnaCnng76680D, partial [Brassica napus]